MIDHFANTGKLCKPNSFARQLADAATCSSSRLSELNSISKKMNSFRNLKRFFFADLKSH